VETAFVGNIVANFYQRVRVVFLFFLAAKQRAFGLSSTFLKSALHSVFDV
jgi:hypothetical protein